MARIAVSFCAICCMIILFAQQAVAATPPVRLVIPYNAGQYTFFHGPTGLDIDSNGNIYVLDSADYLVQKFSPDRKLIRAWGSQGLAEGQFYWPKTLTIDEEDNIYISDGRGTAGGDYQPYAATVHKFDDEGGFIRRWGDRFSVLYVTSDKSGGIHTIYWNWDHGIASFTLDGEPTRNISTHWIAEAESLVFDSNLDMYTVNDFYVRQINSDGVLLNEFGGEGTSEGKFGYHLAAPVAGIAIDASNSLYIADTGNHRIQKFDTSGNFIGKWGSPGNHSSEFNIVSTLATDHDGCVYAIDYGNRSIQKFNDNGNFVWQMRSHGTGPGEFLNPTRLAYDNNGCFYVVDQGNNRIQKFTTEGKFITEWGGQGNGPGQFDFPFRSDISFGGICVDQGDYVYIADTGNHRVQKFTKDGLFVSQWGSYGSESTQFISPTCIAYDSNGFIYVGDFGNNRISKYTAEGHFVKHIPMPYNAYCQISPIDLCIDSQCNIYFVGYAGPYDEKALYVIKQGNTMASIIASPIDCVAICRGDAVFCFSNYFPGPFHAPNAPINGEGALRQLDTSSQSLSDVFQFQYGSEPGKYSYVSSMIVDDAGNFYLSDMLNNRIQIIGTPALPPVLKNLSAVTSLLLD